MHETGKAGEKRSQGKQSVLLVLVLSHCHILLLTNMFQNINSICILIFNTNSPNISEQSGALVLLVSMVEKRDKLVVLKEKYQNNLKLLETNVYPVHAKTSTCV